MSRARTLPTDVVLVILANVLMASLFWGCDPAKISGQSPTDPTATSRAALALAQAQRERETLAKLKPCVADKDQSIELAKKTGRMLVWWVGMRCCDSPNIRIALADAIHCHCDISNGDKTPRVIVFDPTDYTNAKRWLKEDLKDETAQEMLQWWSQKKTEKTAR